MTEPDATRTQRLRAMWHLALSRTPLSEQWRWRVDEPVAAQDSDAYSIDLHLALKDQPAETRLTLEVPRPAVYTPDRIAPRIVKLWMDGRIDAQVLRIDLDNLDDLDDPNEA